MRTTRSLEEIQQDGPQWQERADRERVPVACWGRDHWSLLICVDERVVNWHGLLDWNQVQVSQRNWPMLWAARIYGHSDPKDGADYGLRLKPDEDGRPVMLAKHCQVDALMDLTGEGLVTLRMPEISPSGQSFLRPDGHALSTPTPHGLITGHVEWLLMPWAKFGLTERGWEVAAALRRHKGSGLLYADFEMPERKEE